MAPKFSVIVPVYNVEQYVGECISSVLAQTLQDFELIIIDDVSSDNSLQIARSFALDNPSTVRLIPHAVNTGLGGARNTGIEAAAGEYLMFLDSDDYLCPETLEELNNVLTAHNPDIVEFCFRMVDEQGGYLRQSYCQETDDVPALARTVNACNKVFRAALFSDVRFPEKRYYEDYCTIPKLLMAAKRISSLNKPLYNYRQRTGSIIHDTNIEKNRDILWGTDMLLAYCNKKDLGPDMQMQLEYLAICHVLYHAILRVNGIDRHSDLQNTLKDYVQTHFPENKSNPYRIYLSPKEHSLLSLIEKEKWNTLYLRYHMRNKITGRIKRLLQKLKGK